MFPFSYRKKRKILKIQRKSKPSLPLLSRFIKESTEAEIRRIPGKSSALSFLFRLLIRRSVEIKNAFEENIFLLHFLYFKQIQIQKNSRNSFVKRYFNSPGSSNTFPEQLLLHVRNHQEARRIYRVTINTIDPDLQTPNQRNMESWTRRKIPPRLVSSWSTTFQTTRRTNLSIRG